MKVWVGSTTLGTITRLRNLGNWGSALYSLGSTVHKEARLWQTRWEVKHSGSELKPSGCFDSFSLHDHTKCGYAVVITNIPEVFEVFKSETRPYSRFF